MKRLFALLMLLSLLVLAACSDTTPNLAPTPDNPETSVTGFRFDVDPSSQQVSVTAIGMDGNALRTQQAGGARLLEPGTELIASNVRAGRASENVATITATFENVTTDESFGQPFTFRPALAPQQGNYLSSTEPTVTDADLGGDGVLSPGESTSTLTFTVRFKSRPFSYFVNAYAVEQQATKGCGADGVFQGDVTIREQAVLDTLEGCTTINGSLSINTDASTLDFSPLNGLETVTGDLIIGSLNVDDDSSLTSVAGFGQLETVGGRLFIILSKALVSVSGFGQLETVGGDLSIFGNDRLVSVAGFESLKIVGDDVSIDFNVVLASIPEFGALEQVSGFLSIDLSALTSVTGFGQLKTVGGLVISENGALVSVAGFEQLETVGVPGFSSPFNIGENGALVSIVGFDSLSSENVFATSSIFDNRNFDCSVPPQSNLPFLPVDRSFGNLVDCPTK